MNFDEFANMAGKAAQDAARGADRPNIGDVGVVRRRRSVTVATLSFVGVIIVVGLVAAWPGPRPSPDAAATDTSVTTTQPIGTTIADAALPQGLIFVPPAIERDGTTEVDLTLPDGSVVAVAYPSGLDLTSRGLEATAVATLGDGLRRLEVRYGSIEERVAYIESVSGVAERVAVYPNGRGGGAERWEFTRSGEVEASLFFEFGSWTVEMPDALGARPESEAEWARALRGSETNDGYLILTADSPVDVIPMADELGPDGPDLRIGGESGDLLFFLNDCARMSGQFDDNYDVEVFAWCDESTDTLLFATGDPSVLKQLHTLLEIRVVDAVLPSEPEAPFSDDGSCGIDNIEEGWQVRAFQIGPLWLWTLGAGSGTESYDAATKTLAILEPGASVTLRVPPESRDLVSLIFDPSTWNQAGEYRIADGHSAVTFRPCGERPSQFVGGFVFAEGNSCTELEVTIGDAPPRRLAVPIGGGCDPTTAPFTPQTPSTYNVGDTVWIGTDCPIANGVLRANGGDALPKKGQTDKQRVDAVLAEGKDALIESLGAVDARVIPRNGQVWDGPGDGVYTIEDVPDYQVRVTLGPDAPCPSGPYSWNGIPVLFFRE